MSQIILMIILMMTTIPAVLLNADASSEYSKKCLSVSEPDDSIYCNDFDWSAFNPDRESVDEMCDASEDYAKNPKNCDKAYDMVENEEKIKNICEDVGGEMKKDGCHTDHDGPKADKFEEKMTEELLNEGSRQEYDDIEETAKEMAESEPVEEAPVQEVESEDWRNDVEVEESEEQEESEDDNESDNEEEEEE